MAAESSEVPLPTPGEAAIDLQADDGIRRGFLENVHRIEDECVEAAAEADALHFELASLREERSQIEEVLQHRIQDTKRQTRETEVEARIVQTELDVARELQAETREADNLARQRLHECISPAVAPATEHNWTNIAEALRALKRSHWEAENLCQSLHRELELSSADHQVVVTLVKVAEGTHSRTQKDVETAKAETQEMRDSVALLSREVQCMLGETSEVVLEEATFAHAAAETSRSLRGELSESKVHIDTLEAKVAAVHDRDWEMRFELASRIKAAVRSHSAHSSPGFAGSPIQLPPSSTFVASPLIDSQRRMAGVDYLLDHSAAQSPRLRTRTSRRTRSAGRSPSAKSCSPSPIERSTSSDFHCLSINNFRQFARANANMPVSEAFGSANSVERSILTDFRGSARQFMRGVRSSTSSPSQSHCLCHVCDFIHQDVSPEKEVVANIIPRTWDLTTPSEEWSILRQNLMRSNADSPAQSPDDEKRGRGFLQACSSARSSRLHSPGSTLKMRAR